MGVCDHKIFRCDHIALNACFPEKNGEKRRREGRLGRTQAVTVQGRRIPGVTLVSRTARR